MALSVGCSVIHAYGGWTGAAAETEGGNDESGCGTVTYAVVTNLVHSLFE